MEYIPWSENLSVYHNFVDAQHQDLVEQVNRLFRANKQKDLLDSQLDQLAQLIQAMRTHFNTEEVLMQATSFPGIHVHRREHKDHMEELVEALETAKVSGGLSGDVFLTLRAVVIDHMQNTDLEFGEYLKKFMEDHPDAPLPYSNDQHTGAVD